MEATPDVYRADIAHTKYHIALIDAELGGDTSSLGPGVVQGKRVWRALLVRHLAGLERRLAQVEPLWAEAQARGAGVRLD